MVKELRLFFLDVGVSNAKDSLPQGRILSCRPDGSALKTVVEGIGTLPDGLAMDPQHRHIYYTNMGEPSTDSGSVSRVDLDGKNDIVVIHQGVTWTQKGPSKGNAGRLFCAGLDIPQGETADTRSDKRLLLDHLPEPINLDLDLKANVMYMSDRGDIPFGNSINRIDLNNHDKVSTTILVKKLHEAIGLTFDIEKQQMYFTDLCGAVYTAKMDGGDEKVLLSDVGDLTGITSCSLE